LSKFWGAMEEVDCDFVVGKQEMRRKQSFATEYLHGLFYKLYNKLNMMELDPNEMVVRLMNRNYIDAIIEYNEYNLFLPAIWNDLGFQKKIVGAEKASSSSSSYTLKKKILLSIDAIASSSSALIYMLFFIGGVIFLISFISTLLVGVRWFLYEMPLGWASLIISIWMGVGVIMMTLGVIGIYIAKIFNEVKGRPRVNVRRLHGMVSPDDL